MKHKKRTKAAQRTMAMAAAVIAAVALLMIVTLSRILVVRDIMVVGNRSLPAEAVVTQSGVKVGDHLLGRSVANMKEELEKNRYISYNGYEFDYKGRLTIRIEERLGMAVVSSLGIFYVIDEAGMVLECAGSAYPTNAAGPKVTGLSIEDNAWIVVGERLPVRDENQLGVMESVLLAMDETNMLSCISQLDVAAYDNLYAMTSEGVKIELGENTNLRTKLLIAREVLTARELEGGLRGAKIDVSNGKNAHFIPAVRLTPTPVPTATPTIDPSSTPS